MKHLISLTIVLIVMCHALYAQPGIDSIVRAVEQNNTTLLSLRKNAEAELLAFRTGIFLQNPEISYNHLWGSPAITGNRNDLSITQSFDFPTTYAYRNQIADLSGEKVATAYEKEKMAILLEARQKCIDLVYANALKVMYTKRLENARRIAKSFEARFQSGEINVLDYHKAQLNLLNMQQEAEKNERERGLLLASLTGMNGGKSVLLTDSVFVSQAVDTAFESFIANAQNNNPSLRLLAWDMAVSQKQEKLVSALSLPKFQAGYMSESVVGQQFQGLTVGMTLPLWENKNTLKHQRARTAAIRGSAADEQLRFYNELKALHSKAIKLQASIVDYKKNLALADNTVLLNKALEAGEISLVSYLFEQSFFIESQVRVLDSEKELQQVIAVLQQYQ